MQNEHQYGVKTGRLLPSRRPERLLDFSRATERAEKLCFGTRSDTVLYHDERGGLSLRTVRDVLTMYVPKYVLAYFRFRDGRVIVRSKL
jgi:hypothetical protein